MENVCRVISRAGTKWPSADFINFDLLSGSLGDLGAMWKTSLHRCCRWRVSGRLGEGGRGQERRSDQQRQ